jgi:hypothetical protein
LLTIIQAHMPVSEERTVMLALMPVSEEDGTIVLAHKSVSEEVGTIMQVHVSEEEGTIMLLLGQ